MRSGARWARELAEPWGLLFGAVAGGVAWAVQVPTLAAVGVGGVVWLARGVVAGAGRAGGEPAEPARVDAGTEEAALLARARSAAADFAGLARELPAGPLAERMLATESEVDDTVAVLHRLAGQASSTGRALARIDPSRLSAEATRLRQSRRRASGEVAAELDRSLASVKSQQDVHQRLSSARAKQVAQLESGALGVEDLVARLVELSTTTSPTAPGADAPLDGLTDRLEGIRNGVAETEAATRRTLGDQL